MGGWRVIAFEGSNLNSKRIFGIQSKSRTVRYKKMYFFSEFKE